jgi:hypothetical protein
MGVVSDGFEGIVGGAENAADAAEKSVGGAIKELESVGCEMGDLPLVSKPGKDTGDREQGLA